MVVSFVFDQCLLGGFKDAERILLQLNAEVTGRALTHMSDGITKRVCSRVALARVSRGLLKRGLKPRDYIPD